MGEEGEAIAKPGEKKATAIRLFKKGMEPDDIADAVDAAFFYYSSTRNGDIAKRLLCDFPGYLVPAAYSGYEKAEYVKRSLCWSHCRRYFIDSIPLDSKGKEISCSRVFDD